MKKNPLGPDEFAIITAILCVLVGIVWLVGWAFHVW